MYPLPLSRRSLLGAGALGGSVVVATAATATEAEPTSDTSKIDWTGPREAPSDPAGPTGRLCTWLADLHLDDVPGAVRERAKDVLLDGVGCAIVGAQLPWSRTAVEASLKFEGRGDRTIIGWGRKAPAMSAALLNGTFIQGFELDDVHPKGPLHCGSLVIPALLACSEERGPTSGAQVLLGAVAGFEVGPRVGNALHGDQLLSRGWHSGAVIGAHASAAATGMLLNLDASRFEDAFGMAGAQSAGLMAAQFEAMCKRMHHGFASRNGMFSALMAAGGYTGIKSVFERKYGGYLAMFGEGHDPLPEEVASGLGVRWETPGILLKPYAAMGALHGAIEGTLTLMAERPLSAPAIKSIDIYVSDAAYQHGWWKLERPITPVGAQMNFAYAVAATILDGESTVRQFSPNRINRDDVWGLIPKITAHNDKGFNEGGKATEFSTRLRVTMNDRSTREILISTPKTFSHALTREDIIHKFNRLTDGLITKDRQQRIIETVLTLDKVKDVSVIGNLLGPPVGSAF